MSDKHLSRVRVGDLLRDRRRLRDRQRAARDQCREVVAVDELHDERARASRLLEPVDRGDVRMLELREQLRFALEPRQTLGIRHECRGQHLDRDVALELRIGRAIDLAHPARAQLSGDFVRAEA